MSSTIKYLDLSRKQLTTLPNFLYDFADLQMLYLEGNELCELPDDFFKKLQSLRWLDLRNNRLCKIPVTIKFHQCLQTILLQNNQLKELPYELGSIPNLKVIQCSNNPFSENYPSENLIEYLRDKYNKTEKPIKVKSNSRKTVFSHKSQNKMKMNFTKSTLHEMVFNIEDQNLVTNDKIIQKHQLNLIVTHLQNEFQKQSAELQHRKNIEVIEKWRNKKSTFSKNDYAFRSILIPDGISETNQSNKAVLNFDEMLAHIKNSLNDLDNFKKQQSPSNKFDEKNLILIEIQRLAKIHKQIKDLLERA